MLSTVVCGPCCVTATRLAMCSNHPLSDCSCTHASSNARVGIGVAGLLLGIRREHGPSWRCHGVHVRACGLARQIVRGLDSGR
eukprot:7038841-Prymnesium_polylepis.1